MGVFSSPHILEYNERFRIDGINVDDQIIVSAFEEVESLRGIVSLTYFEFSTLAALVIFRNLQIDIAILEVGMGGRLDSVNVTSPDLTIITSIDIDHSEYLGNTRERIALEKAGIMRRGITCLCGDQTPPRSLSDEAKKIGSKLQFIKKPYSGSIKMSGTHQQINAQVAVEAINCLKPYFDVSSNQIIKGLKMVRLPGRFEKVLYSGRLIILDVAHNPAAVNELKNTLKHLNLKINAVYSSMKDKDIKQIVRNINEFVSIWHFAPMNSIRSSSLEELEKIFIKYENSKGFETVSSAFNSMLKYKDKKPILVFGSFQIISEVSDLILNLPEND